MQNSGIILKTRAAVLLLLLLLFVSAGGAEAQTAETNQGQLPLLRDFIHSGTPASNEAKPSGNPSSPETSSLETFFRIPKAAQQASQPQDSEQPGAGKKKSFKAVFLGVLDFMGLPLFLANPYDKAVAPDINPDQPRPSSGRSRHSSGQPQANAVRSSEQADQSSTTPQQHKLPESELDGVELPDPDDAHAQSN